MTAKELLKRQSLTKASNRHLVVPVEVIALDWVFFFIHQIKGIFILIFFRNCTNHLELVPQGVNSFSVIPPNESVAFKP